MAWPILRFVVLLVIYFPPISSSASDSLSQGSSLSVEDVLTSPNGLFSAGFYLVGDNAYCFAIWFRKPLNDGSLTVVWMANRDQPVNGKLSKLSLTRTGNLILTDAGQISVWTSATSSIGPVRLQLHNTGNLAIFSSNQSRALWQSFDFPTDTLLPQQPLSKNSMLVSSRSKTNYSSGFYRLYFDNDNVLRLLYDSRGQITSVFWPAPWLNSWENGRSTYNNTRTALFDSSGHFLSSDDFKFSASDLGKGVQRRLAMDVDGNVRMYSLDERRRTWEVSWQVMAQPCRVHGICGPNSLCTYDVHHEEEESGKRCSCLPGHKMKDSKDWAFGCEPEFHFSCGNRSDSDSDFGFFELTYVEFFGFDFKFIPNLTLPKCKEECLRACACLGFQFKFDYKNGYYLCYLKSLLLNGQRSPSFEASMYIKLPRAALPTNANYVDQDFKLNCSVLGHGSTLESRPYKKPKENEKLEFVLWFFCAFGGIEFICICSVWCFLYNTREDPVVVTQAYSQAAIRFKRFSYKELKKVTDNFREEIGRGGCGVVYRGKLSDGRDVAIKRLDYVDASHGEAEFLAEVSTIGRLNHMNLIEMWGYCAEGKHRLLVYEYMEHGSLAERLSSRTLDWEKRFEIAIGTAKGLAYLHEECLEWVLHCDVKPQNILLGANYHPKVADFGLSKLLKRGDGSGSGSDSNPSFSKVRGTRGYMAPEWILNLPITSKVDVYSYGIVMLEMVTGKSQVASFGSTGEMEQMGLVKWVREKTKNGLDVGIALSVNKIADPAIEGAYDSRKMVILVGVALQCVEEDRDARPTMSQVVEMLSSQEER